MDNYSKNLAQNIRALRKQAGLTQEALAEKLGISFQAVSKWENEVSSPDITLLPQLAEIFAVPVDTLFGSNAQLAAPKAISPTPSPVAAGSMGTSIQAAAAQEQIPLKGIANIDVQTHTLDCNLYLTQEPVIRAVLISDYAPHQRASLQVQQQQDRLIIYAKARPYRSIFGFRRPEHIDLYLPAECHTAVMLQSSSGSIRVADMLQLEQFHAQTASGSITLSALQATSYHLQSISGSIRVQSLHASGSARSTSGGVHIQELSGQSHTLRSTSGSIHVQKGQGSLQARSTSGSVHIQEHNGQLQAQNTSGSIHVETFAGFGSCDTMSGSIKLRNVTLDGDLQLHSTSGSIRVAFRETPSMDLEAKSNSGSIRTNFAARGSHNFKIATLGAGQHRLRAQTVSGSMHFECP